MFGSFEGNTYLCPRKPGKPLPASATMQQYTIYPIVNGCSTEGRFTGSKGRCLNWLFKHAHEDFVRLGNFVMLES